MVPQRYSTKDVPDVRGDASDLTIGNSHWTDGYVHIPEGSNITFEGEFEILNEIDLRDYFLIVLPSPADVWMRVRIKYPDTDTYIYSTEKVDEIRYI